MRRWIWFIMVAAALLLLPEGQQTDISHLHPVQLLYIYKEEGKIVLETDVGDKGKGETLPDAVKNLHATSEGELFLETVEYLLVTEETKSMILELGDIVRPATNLVVALTGVNTEKAVQYLEIRRPEVTLLDYRTGVKELPKLVEKEGRCCLE